MRCVPLWAVCLSALLGMLFCSESAWAQAPEPSPPQTAEAANPDWVALRKSREAYLAAFNAGDAKALGELYLEDAEFGASWGAKFEGRQAIVEEFAAFFKEFPDAQLVVNVNKISFVGGTVAMEDGTTELKWNAEAPPSFSRYVAVHSKQKDGWRLASVRDERLPLASRDRLDELKWMIGQWIDESPNSLMEIDCYWHESGSYLIRDFRIKIEGLLASSGTERIGWDPLRKQVRSWLFDADGGYLEGAWSQTEHGWSITASGFRADGTPIVAAYEMTPLRDAAYHMHATNRMAGEVRLDNFEMTVVKRPPAPGELPALELEANSSQEPQE